MLLVDDKSLRNGLAFLALRDVSESGPATYPEREAIVMKICHLGDIASLIHRILLLSESLILLDPP